jgi:hypothetical protein
MKPPQNLYPDFSFVKNWTKRNDAPFIQGAPQIVK